MTPPPSTRRPSRAASRRARYRLRARPASAAPSRSRRAFDTSARSAAACRPAAYRRARRETSSVGSRTASPSWTERSAPDGSPRPSAVSAIRAWTSATVSAKATARRSSARRRSRSAASSRPRRSWRPPLKHRRSALDGGVVPLLARYPEASSTASVQRPCQPRTTASQRPRYDSFRTPEPSRSIAARASGSMPATRSRWPGNPAAARQLMVVITTSSVPRDVAARSAARAASAAASSSRARPTRAMLAIDRAIASYPVAPHAAATSAAWRTARSCSRFRLWCEAFAPRPISAKARSADGGSSGTRTRARSASDARASKSTSSVHSISRTRR